VNVCFCCIRFSFFPSRSSLEWPILCRVKRKATTQSVLCLIADCNISSLVFMFSSICYIDFNVIKMNRSLLLNCFCAISVRWEHDFGVDDCDLSFDSLLSLKYVYLLTLFNVVLFSCLEYKSDRSGVAVRMPSMFRLCTTSNHAMSERPHCLFSLPSKTTVLSNVSRHFRWAFSRSLLLVKCLFKFTTSVTQRMRRFAFVFWKPD